MILYMRHIIKNINKAGFGIEPGSRIPIFHFFKDKKIPNSGYPWNRDLSMVFLRDSTNFLFFSLGIS